MTLARVTMLGATLAVPSTASGAPVVASAAIRIVVSSPTTCEVSMALRVDGASEVEHRIESFDGSQVVVEEVRGAEPIAEPQTIGRTRALVLRLQQPDYEIRYRAWQGDSRRDRCPMWVPTIPTTGQLAAIRVEIQLPPGSRPASSMPALSWNGVTGTAMLANVPAFVRAPYAATGEAAAWDLLRVMDGLAVTVFVAASSVWLWRRRRRGPTAGTSEPWG